MGKYCQSLYKWNIKWKKEKMILFMFIHVELFGFFNLVLLNERIILHGRLTLSCMAQSHSFLCISTAEERQKKVCRNPSLILLCFNQLYIYLTFKHFLRHTLNIDLLQALLFCNNTLIEFNYPWYFISYQPLQGLRLLWEDLSLVQSLTQSEYSFFE